LLLPKLFRSIAANGSSASAVLEDVEDLPAEAVAGLVEVGLVDAGLAEVGFEGVGFAVVGFALLVAGDLLFSVFSEDTLAESDLACPAGLAGAFSENSAEQLPHFTRLSAGIDLISMGCLHFGHCSVGIKTISPTAALASPTAIVPNEIQIDVSNRNSTC
jgi:hypothetical protein